MTENDAAFARAYQHLTGRSPQPGDWFADFARRVWDAATKVERERCRGIAEGDRYTQDDWPVCMDRRDIADAIRGGGA